MQSESGIQKMNKRYDVLGVGIAAVDDLLYVAEYPPSDCKIPVSGSVRQGGGPACTAMATVGTMGGRAAYVARFGRNELSNYISSSLELRGVDTSHIVYDPTGGPYHSVIVVDREGHRNVFYDPALYRAVTAEDLSETLIRSTKLVLLDHITDPSLAPAARKIRNLGVPIMADIEGHTESAIELVEFADYLVVSASFATWMSKESDPRAACSSLAAVRRSATVVTDGQNGCYLCTSAGRSARHFPAFQVNAFDTNGCGDTFHGAFAFAIARNVAVEHAILFASATAALKATAAGGKRRGWEAIPTRDEVLDFLRTRLDEPARSSILKQLHLLLEPTNPVQ